MRKENEALKKKYTLQIQDLRRQLVTKKAFDEDESQREISRLKKELHFMLMQLNDVKRAKRTLGMENMQTESSNVNHTTAPKSGPMTGTLSHQEMEKEQLEMENEKLQALKDQMETRSKVMSNNSYRGMDVMEMLDGESYLRSEVM